MPVARFRVYEARTRDFRPVDSFKPDSLYQSYTQPQKPVTSATLARWTKVSSKEAGIGITIFTAHSVRGAPTEAAANKGI